VDPALHPGSLLPSRCDAIQLLHYS
jgi:hypothetical protein